MPSEDVKAINALKSQLKGLKAQMNPSQLKKLNQGGGRARAANSRNIGSSQPMKFLKANMTNEVKRAKNIVKPPKGGGAGGTFGAISHLISMPAARAASNSSGKKMPKKLRGKVKGVGRKA